MNAAVCDASVLFKLAVTEPDSDRALARIHSTSVIVPEFVFLEIGNALWHRVHRGRLQEYEAGRLLADIYGLDLDVRPMSDLVARALSLATAIRHQIHDCLYLALADKLNVPLVTADTRFLATLRHADLPTADRRR